MDDFTMLASSWIATQNFDVGAGFYTSSGGPLPFAFGRVPPDELFVYILKQPAGNWR